VVKAVDVGVSLEVRTFSTTGISAGPEGPGLPGHAYAGADAARRFLRPEVVRAVARLDLKARFIVEGFLQGIHRSPFHGFSVEFSDYRDYAPGDDPSHIDWKLYARTDKYYVKRYQAETNLRCMLMVDTSASMHYASGGKGALTKLEYAVALSASLGYLMIRQQDRVGLMTLDTRVRAHVPPRSKKVQLFRILDQLLRARPTERTDLAKALSTAAPLIRRKGLVVLFSDLLDEPGPVVRELRHLRHRGQDVICFQVLDPAELRLPFTGPHLFEDPETGMLVSADSRTVRKAYIDRLHALLRAYRRQMRAHRIDHLLMDTSTPFQRALLKFLLYRRRRH
jgi:uncharacterized protein (DUF58 family)